MIEEEEKKDENKVNSDTKNGNKQKKQPKK
jgi:hypothetical protein